MNIALEDPIKLSVYTVRVVPLIMFMWTRVICCDYIKSDRFLYFHRPINIILSVDSRDYINNITRRLP